MAEPVLLYSTATLTDADIAALLNTVGAVPAEVAAYDGRLSEGDRHVWIANSPEVLTELEQDGTPDEHARIVALLGGWPQTCITLSVSRKPGSDRLAMHFILTFAEQWPCIVDDLMDHLYTSAEVQALYEAGGSFEDALRDPLQV